MRESPVTYTDLLVVNFGSFATAVGDWKRAQSALQTLATEANDGMRAKSDAAHWEGVNAGLGKRFVRKIANEIGDLHSEAHTIWNLLDGAHTDLVALQKKLKAEKERAERAKIRIQDNGDGTVTCEFRDVSGTFGPISGASVAKEPAHTAAEHEAKDDIQGRINTFIADARMIDQSVQRALTRSHGNDPHNAGHATYTSLDDAQAEQAAAYARKQLKLYEEGKELLTKDLEFFAALTKHNAKDPEFTTSFYRDLGPEGALRLHAQLGIDASTDGGKERLELARVIQNSMGTGLATATDSPTFAKVPPNGDATHLGSTWINALKREGRATFDLKKVGVVSKVKGYQVLGNILRHGEYDKKFLTNIATDMVTYERSHGGSAAAWPHPPRIAGEVATLSLDRKGGAGYDPMTGLMESLGRSPEAATTFFQGHTAAPDSGAKFLNNLDYLLGDDDGNDRREWINDAPRADSPESPGTDSLGQALEAATTGRAANDDGPSLPHTKDQAEVFHRTVEKLGSKENSSLLEHGGKFYALNDSLGDMSADYMHDIQRAVALDQEATLIGKTKESADSKLWDVDGARLERFLASASQDPDGYASITHASHTVSLEVMKDELHDHREDGRHSQAAIRAARPGGEIAAFAADGRAHGIEGASDKVAEAEKYNASLEEKGKWVQRVVDMGASTVPFAGDAVSWIAEDAQEAVIGGQSKNPEELARVGEESRKDFLANERKKEAEIMKRLVATAADQAGIKNKSDVDELKIDVSAAAQEGFRNVS